MDKTYSLADIAAVSGNRNDGIFGGDSSGFIVLILFLIMLSGGAGFGWGGNANGVLTRAELSQGFDNQSVLRKLDGITYGLSDGFYAQNTTMLNGFNTIGSQIAENRFAQQNCCCNIERNIDSVKYENAKNTCDIIRAGQDNTRAILDYLTGEQISSLQAENAGLKAQISNDRQSAYIIDKLSPCPTPSYVVQAPTKVNFPTDCCGNFTGFGGCGCN